MARRQSRRGQTPAASEAPTGSTAIAGSPATAGLMTVTDLPPERWDIRLASSQAPAGGGEAGAKPVATIVDDPAAKAGAETQDSAAKAAPPAEGAEQTAPADGLRLVMIECPLAPYEGPAIRTLDQLSSRTARTLRSFAAGLAAAGMRLESGKPVQTSTDAVVYLCEQLEAGASGQA